MAEDRLGSAVVIRALVGTVLLLFASAWGRPAEAAEGASSNYFPGSYRNLLVAVAPEPESS